MGEELPIRLVRSRRKTLAIEVYPGREVVVRAAARDRLPDLVARYAGLLGVRPARLSITGARTRFGSCSSKGGIAFSFRLMAYPLPAI